MKIATMVNGTDHETPVAERFGRAANILVYDTESKRWKLVSNTVNLAAVQGAGIQTAEGVCNTGAKVLITTRCGPKAFRVLRAGGVDVFSAPAQAQTAGEVVMAFLDGKLTQLVNPDVKRHWA